MGEEMESYEKALVKVISQMAKVSINNENEIISCTSELVNAIKNISQAATRLMEALKKNNNHLAVHTTALTKNLEKVSLDTDGFQQKREKLHETIKAFVASIKDGSLLAKNQGDPIAVKNNLLSRLKTLALAAKELIDIVHTYYPSRYEQEQQVHTVPSEDEVEGDDEDDEDDRNHRNGDSNGNGLLNDSASNNKLNVSQNFTCSRCQKRIDNVDKLVRYEGKFWHSECFLCGVCQNVIMSHEFFLMNSQPTCENCSPKCAACGLVVTRNCIAALRKYYHALCFRCAGCKVLISNTSRFYQRDGRPCCSKCVSRDSVFDHPYSSIVEVDRDHDDEDDEEEGEKREGEEKPTGQAEKQVVQETSRVSTNGSSYSDESVPPTPALSRPPSQNQADPRCLQGVLGRESGITYLIQFCLEDYTVEKIFFWLDVQQYKMVIVKPDELHGYAKSIRRKYIYPDAEMSLNLPEAIRTEIETSLEQGVENCHRDIFKTAEDIVYGELEGDIFPRFFYSLAGKKYLAQVMEEEKQQARTSKFGVLKLNLNTIKSRSNTEKAPQKPTTQMRSSITLVDETTVVDIINFEKRYGKQKYYVYEIQISRQSTDIPNSTETSIIYRRYSQFFEMHTNFLKYFPDETFPPFPPKIYIGRSQIKTVAILRMQDLDYYLKGLLAMKKPILQSEILLNFLKANEEDLQNYWFNKRLSQTSNNFASKYH